MCGQEKSLRDRIEALTGWDKEAQDILEKIIRQGSYAGSPTIEIRVVSSNCSEGIIVRGENWECWKGEKSFQFDSQCSKLRAFKDALLWLLDKSGIEKSKVREGLEAEVKELKDKLAGLERKIEEVGR